jgi:hypothetical protein
MQSPGVRLTGGTMMIAVVAATLILVAERFLYRSAAHAVSSHSDGDYIWGEAVTVWLILNIVLSVPAGMIAQMTRAYATHRAEGQKRIG